MILSKKNVHDSFPHAILRLPAVCSETGLSRSTLYLNVSKGLLTRPIKISTRAVGWPGNEIFVLNAARIAGKNEEEIKALVCQLEADRMDDCSSLNEDDHG